MKIIPNEVKTSVLHQYLLGAVSPRPICFASTLNADGTPNLAPFSFFGVFGSNPPIVVFSPARRVRDNTLKHTLENIKLNKEVVINMVNYSMVQQMSLASCEYPEGVDEFVKAGFTPLSSDFVRPFRVAESPAALECVVDQIIETGLDGGAGNLIICKVVCMHVSDSVLDAEQKIDPNKIDLVARMGGDFYCRASGEAVFTVPKPNTNLGIGFDNLPKHIIQSDVLSGNDLGILANVSSLPLIDTNWSANKIIPDNIADKHLEAKNLILKGMVDDAWQMLLH